jgi:hypothetical protein
MTHRKSEPCPYKDDNNPIGVFGSCCSFRGNATALYLFAMGMASLGLRLYEDKLPEVAIEFAAELRAAVAKQRDVMSEASRRAGLPEPLPTDKLTVKIPDVGWEYPVEQAFQAIEAAAVWHEKTGRMLAGIHAWF